MSIKKLGISLVSASLVFVPIERAQAGDAAAAIGGMLLGGIIVNEVNKNKQRQQVTTTRRTSSRSSVSSAQREQNRQVQSALNYFGYNVGAVDGSIGRNTRYGVSRYQADMGYNADGYLDDYERDFLINSHQRALASSHVAPYNAVLASQGQQGLLRTYRNEQLGIPTVDPQGAGAQMAAAPAAVAAAPTPVASAPAPEAKPAGLPSFTFAKTGRSATDFCTEINALTADNGGFTAASQVSDVEFALGEQFCLSRTQAIAESGRIIATIPDMDDSQIKAQCDGLTQAITPHVAGLANKRADQVIAETAAVLRDSGQPMDQLVASGKVCLGIGYKTDDAQMALASAVLLSAAGQLGYGEAVSHHMREGFGTARASAPQATSWMVMALESLDAGGISATGQTPSRVAVLKAAMQDGTETGAGTSLAVFPTKN